jgi:hypothetical protein
MTTQMTTNRKTRCDRLQNDSTNLIPTRLPIERVSRYHGLPIRRACS